jgi:YebC/PmpR family DNA-binding regulatory protein
MSGHSKWSKVKHQKATTDVVKSMAFTKASRAVTVAVLEGGGIADPDKNFKLRLAIEKAHDVNMPRENIERAIAKATNKDEAAFDQITYEGYGPGGVAILVEAATNNHQRTSANIKHEFDHMGGSIASPGAVSFLFTRSGILVVEKSGKPYDAMVEAAITAGADDVIERTDMFEVYTSAHTVSAVKDALTKAGWIIDNWEVIMKPITPFHPEGEGTYQKNEELIEALSALDDVQSVFSTLE